MRARRGVDERVLGGRWRGSQTPSESRRRAVYMRKRVRASCEEVFWGCCAHGSAKRAARGAVHRGRRLLPISTSEDTGMARRRTTHTGAGLRARMKRHDATTCGGHLAVLAVRNSCAGGIDRGSLHHGHAGTDCATAAARRGGRTGSAGHGARAAKRAAHARRPRLHVGLLLATH
jgi:hypothetical protein